MWAKLYDETRKQTYYYNSRTGRSQWHAPPEMTGIRPPPPSGTSSSNASPSTNAQGTNSTTTTTTTSSSRHSSPHSIEIPEQIKLNYSSSTKISNGHHSRSSSGLSSVGEAVLPMSASNSPTTTILKPRVLPMENKQRPNRPSGLSKEVGLRLASTTENSASAPTLSHHRSSLDNNINNSNHHQLQHQSGYSAAGKDMSSYTNMTRLVSSPALGRSSSDKSMSGEIKVKRTTNAKVSGSTITAGNSNEVADLSSQKDRRYWGRPDRTRTMSGDDLNLIVEPNYRFRTSSSADLVALMQLTGVSSKPSSKSGEDQSSSISSSAEDGRRVKELTGAGATARIQALNNAAALAAARAAGGSIGSAAEWRRPSLSRTGSGIDAIPEHQVLLSGGDSFQDSSSPIIRSRKLGKKGSGTSSGQNNSSIFSSTRLRANTTNSMHVDHTMSKPDAKAQIRCVAAILHAHMVRFALSMRTHPFQIHPQYEVFNDDFKRESTSPTNITSSSNSTLAKNAKSSSSSVSSSMPLIKPSTIAPQIPDKETIRAFIDRIFSKAQMESECIIMSLVYIERVLEISKGRFALTMKNWQPLVLASLILSSKVWDDLSMWNADFSLISQGYSLKRINELEIGLLEAVKYNVRVSASTYAKYYFQLRGMRSVLGEKQEFVKPLNIAEANKWAKLTDRYQEKSDVSAENRKRSSTLFDGARREFIEKVHKQGPQYKTVGAIPTASLEQVVDMSKHHVQTSFF